MRYTYTISMKSTRKIQTNPSEKGGTMKKLIVTAYSTMTSFVLSAVVGVGVASAQYAEATPTPAASSSQQLAEAGLYGVGLLFLVGLVVLLYIYAPKLKRNHK